MGVTTSAYRWFRNNTLQTGETSDTLSFTLSQNADNGSYTCEATRNGRTFQSNSFPISVQSKSSADLTKVIMLTLFKHSTSLDACDNS